MLLARQVRQAPLGFTYMPSPQPPLAKFNTAELRQQLYERPVCLSVADLVFQESWRRCISTCTALTSSDDFVTRCFNDPDLPIAPLGLLASASCQEPFVGTVQRRARRVNEGQIQPRTKDDLGAVCRVDCNLEEATVCAVHVDLAVLLGSLLYGASCCGQEAAQLREWCRDAEPGLPVVRHMMHMMWAKGVPVLLATGFDTDEKVLKKYHGAHKKFAAGSPLVICDQDDNILALARPMGELVFVSQDSEGFLPAGLKPSNRSLCAAEMWVELVCVAPDSMDKDAWFRNNDPAFNWPLDAKPAVAGQTKSVAGQGSKLYFPRSSLLVDLFPGTTLATLAFVLGDYKAKLAALTCIPVAPAPRQARGRPPAHDRLARAAASVKCGSNFSLWRRAVLLENLLASGAPRWLHGLLPHRMLSERVLPDLPNHCLPDFHASSLDPVPGLSVDEVARMVQHAVAGRKERRRKHTETAFSRSKRSRSAPA